MSRFAVIALVLVAAGVGFIVGRSGMNSDRKFQLLESVEIRVGDRAGMLPSGTILREERVMGETTHYSVLVEMKQRDMLKPFEGGEGISMPVHVPPVAETSPR
jgi:hypothetical protein